MLGKQHHIRLEPVQQSVYFIGQYGQPGADAAEGQPLFHQVGVGKQLGGVALDLGSALGGNGFALGGMIGPSLGPGLGNIRNARLMPGFQHLIQIGNFAAFGGPGLLGSGQIAAGAVTIHEKALKKRTTNALSTSILPKRWTHTYANPAPRPPARAQTAGKASAPRKPGFITSIAPENANSSQNACRNRSRSPSSIHENKTVKNGAVLLSVIASPI